MIVKSILVALDSHRLRLLTFAGDDGGLAVGLMLEALHALDPQGALTVDVVNARSSAGEEIVVQLAEALARLPVRIGMCAE